MRAVKLHDVWMPSLPGSKQGQSPCTLFAWHNGLDKRLVALSQTPNWHLITQPATFRDPDSVIPNCLFPQPEAQTCTSLALLAANHAPPHQTNHQPACSPRYQNAPANDRSTLLHAYLDASQLPSPETNQSHTNLLAISVNLLRLR